MKVLLGRYCAGFSDIIRPLILRFGRTFRLTSAAVSLAAVTALPAVAQTNNFIQDVLRETQQQEQPEQIGIEQAWWDAYVVQPTREQASTTPVDVNTLLSLALTYSAQIQVYSEMPLIRETSVREADAAFDWTHFAESMWRQNNDPVGNTLTLGGPGDRFLDDNLMARTGVRRRTRTGATVGVSQQIGWQDTNSNYFLPEDQGTARLVLDYTVPLMRGRGEAYNTSLQVLTRLDVDVANHEFKRQLQAYLLEVSRGYWSLYLERANLAQQVKLYAVTNRVYEELQARQHIDTSQTQLASARAARESRRSDLIRVQAATENAETRLRALVNAAQLGENNQTELLPVDLPSTYCLRVDLIGEVEEALRNRPELDSAVLEIKAACKRQQVAEHEMLPQLNLVTQAYLAGLRGRSDIGGAWVDQFTEGAPGYGIGLQWERPVGNRAAAARRDRRRLEVRQLQEKYRATLETVRAEVEVAVRELHASQAEVQQRAAAMNATSVEAESLEARWRALPGSDGSAALNLEALLRAFERVATAEYDYAQAIVTYNLSIVNLRRANGTLLQWEQIDAMRVCDRGLPRYTMQKEDIDNR